MPITYSDQEIASLVRERKPLPANWRARTRLKPKRGHHEQHLELIGDAENEFRPVLRRSCINPFDFSIILAIRVAGSSQLFRLHRYNGKSHEHTNHIENVTFHDFHIHFATERYQELGAREDAYADPTDRYDDFDGAFLCLRDDENLAVPHGAQRDMFEEG